MTRARAMRSLACALLALVLAAGALAGCSSAGETSAEADADATEEAAGSEDGSADEAADDDSVDDTDADATEDAAATAVTFTDDLGREVTVTSTERVVACMGSFADAWQNAGGTLVGASDDAFEHYDVDADTVAGVGRSTDLSLESILALEPDFVIMTATTSSKHSTGVSQSELEEALTEAGIAVAFFSVSTLEDYERMMGIFCQITGRDDLYESEVEALQAEVDAIIAESTASESQPTVVVLSASSKGLTIQDSSTLTGSMLADLGCVNVTDLYPSLLDDFSLEALLEIDPDYVFVLAASDDAETAQRYYDEAVGLSDAWAELTAVQEGRVTVLDTAHFLYKPNALWAESYQILADALAQ